MGNKMKYSGLWTQKELDFFDEYSQLLIDYDEKRDNDTFTKLYVAMSNYFRDKNNITNDESFSKVLLCIEYLVNGPQSFILEYRNEYGRLYIHDNLQLFIRDGINYPSTKKHCLTEEKIRNDFVNVLNRRFPKNPGFIKDIISKAKFSRSWAYLGMLE